MSCLEYWKQPGYVNTLNELPAQSSSRQPASMPPSSRKSEEVTAGLDAKIDDLRIKTPFIEELRTVMIDKGNMRQEDIERLPSISSELPEGDDRHFLKALRTFFASSQSEEIYNRYRAVSMACYPDDPFLSFSQIKRQVEIITGVSPTLAAPDPSQPMSTIPRPSK